jgi:hypothetical protein
MSISSVNGMGMNPYVDFNATENLQNSDFKQLFDKITGGEIAQEIRENYNVALSVETLGQMPDTSDINCRNYVSISPGTLSEMEQNPALKKKILQEIEEFCSPKNQAEVDALQPPVKSAGMIIYPDGTALYWLEAYPTEIGSEKSEKIINENSINELLQMYGNADDQVLEKDLSDLMQIMATEYKRKNR